MLAFERVASGDAGFSVDEGHGSSPSRVTRSPAVVVHFFARPRIARISGIERPIRTSDDVDEVQSRNCTAAPTRRDVLLRT